MYLRVACCSFIVWWLLSGTVGGRLPAAAAAAGTAAEPVVAVVYSTNAGQVDEEVRLLDLLLGQFSSNVVLMADGQVDPAMIARSTHLVYFGAVPKPLPDAVVEVLSSFDGPVLAIGENIDQLGGRFDFLDVETTVQVLSVSEPGQARSPLYELSIEANHTRLTGGEQLLVGWTERGVSPLLARNGTTYYLAASYLGNDLFNFVSEKLHGFFDQVPPEIHRAFIRLEDIHPAS